MIDGDFKKATFNRPQGMCLDGETLYVADTENHAIRAIDLKDGKVTTIAGIGTQARRIFAPGDSGPARTTALSSPWDLIQLPGDKALYIAMAGPHQIWKLDLAAGKVSVFAGSGVRGHQDGTAAIGEVRPAERAGDRRREPVRRRFGGLRRSRHHRNPRQGARWSSTIVGEGLFEFGDHDGRGAAVRLQHCLGLAYADGHLYIADTYNNKVKVCDPKARSVKSFVGSHKPGDSDDPPHFYEPGGLSAADSQPLRRRHQQPQDPGRSISRPQAVTTLALEGLSPPQLAARAPVFPNAKAIDVPAVEAAPGKSITLAVTIPLPKEFKLNEEVAHDLPG